MKRREKGLTLIELMVTLAVAIVILAIGLPAFTSMSARDMSTAAVNALVTALQQARAEAVGRGAPVSVWPEAGGWQTGWRVCVGTAACGACSMTKDLSRLRCFAPLRSQLTLSAAGTSPVVFSGGGYSEPQGATISFTVTAYKDNPPHLAKNCVKVTEVVVATSGQIRSEVKSCPL